jgi:hypothetical protein
MEYDVFLSSLTIKKLSLWFMLQFNVKDLCGDLHHKSVIDFLYQLVNQLQQGENQLS